MTGHKQKLAIKTMLLASLMLVSMLPGCILPGYGTAQTSIGGQTLPSAYYLNDDVQFFPAGPEFKLTNTVRAMEEYRLQQEELNAGVEPASAANY